MGYLTNTSFQRDARDWRPYNLSNAVTMNLVANGTARSGANFLRVRTTAANGSVAIDCGVPWFVNGATYDKANQRVFVTRGNWPSVSALAWIRCGPGAATVQGTMAVWQVNANAGPVNCDCKFTVGNSWTFLTCAHDFLDGPEPLVRVELYIATPNVDLDIDSVMVH